MRHHRLFAPAVPLGCAVATVAAGAATHSWSYSGASGPTHWGSTCSAGKAQSPVDIPTNEAVRRKLPALTFDYRPGPLHIIDNGHSVQVNVAGGSTLLVGGVRFTLVQFHFHKPSEETIDGRHFDMVLHLVHRDSAGKVAVVAVPLTSGAANRLIATLWRHLPTQKDREASPRGVMVDPAQLVPARHDYFTYMGSLTTPPCTQGVRWFVMKSAATLSAAQIATFGEIYPHNARPTQPLNGRKILVSS